MNKIFFTAKVALLALLLWLHGAVAQTERIIIGGTDGEDWRSGGGTISPIYKTGVEETGTGNTPGNVLEFDPVLEGFPEGRTGWMFPQKADESVNLASGILARGGRVTSPTVLESDIDAELAKMLDDDGETALERKNVSVIRGMIMDFDLGARFGVSRIEFFPRNAHPEFPAAEFPFQADFLKAYELFFNDGSEDSQNEGRPILSSYILESPNNDPVVTLNIPPQYLRFIRLLSRTTAGFEIAEFRIFGTGFVPTAEYISNIYDMGEELALWGNIRWVQETIGHEAFSEVRVRTRTGEDDTPLVFNRDELVLDQKVIVPWKVGAQITTPNGTIDLDELLFAQQGDTAKAIYAALPLEERNALALTRSEHAGLGPVRGPVTDDLESWSAWSAPYDLHNDNITLDNIEDDAKGVRIISPGPRRYIQFRIEFSSEDLNSSTGVGPLAFTVAKPPPAAQIIGEIFPRQTELAEVATFTYAVLPTNIRANIDRGFDHFEIETPVRVETIERVEVLLPDGSTESADFSTADLNDLPVEDGNFAIEVVEDRRFKVRFPAITRSSLAEGQISRLKIHFSCRVLRFGTKFSGFASLGGTIGQEVLPGNADLLDPGDDDIIQIGDVNQRGLSVDLSSGFSGNLLINVEASPRPFSPNGDGVNDLTTINYDLARLVDATPLSIQVFDLAGRRIRTLFSDAQKGGSFSQEWDGRNNAGQLVPPGIYIIGLDLDSDSGREKVATTVELAY